MLKWPSRPLEDRKVRVGAKNGLPDFGALELCKRKEKREKPGSGQEIEIWRLR
jgi:hypothetical protein